MDYVEKGYLGSSWRSRVHLLSWHSAHAAFRLFARPFAGGTRITTQVLYGGAAAVGDAPLGGQILLIMAVIVGVVGSLIAVQRWLHEAYHEHHKEFPDRRPLFFFLQFVSSGPCWDIFSNSLSLLLFSGKSQRCAPSC